MKTLLVSYTPRGDRSSSKALLDAFRARIRHSEIEELDLCLDPPDLFNVDSTAAYWQRNMMRRLLSDEQSRMLAKIDRMTDQLISADIVAVAFPMFNFSIPAMMKGWFDSVLQVGKTIDPSGGVYRGMMTGRRAMIMVAAGGIYSSGDGAGPNFGPGWEHALSLARLEFQFIGYSDIRGVLAEGMASGDSALSARNLQKAVREVEAVAQAWYS